MSEKVAKVINNELKNPTSVPLSLSEFAQTAEKFQLQKDEIHLWVTYPQNFKDNKKQLPGTGDHGTDQHELTVGDLLEEYKKLLTEQETTRQQRYRFEKDRHDALITRAFIRDLLSHYEKIEPADWRFVKGKHDKPEIEYCQLPLRFNISHTKDLIICAVCLNNDIGCDVENISRTSDVLSIAGRFFSKSESAELLNLPKQRQTSRFFDYWTLKESYIKAWGLGLAIPLADFSFHIGDSSSSILNDNIKLSFAEHRVDFAKDWSSWIMYPNSEHRIALSVRNTSEDRPVNYKLRFFESVPLVSVREISLKEI